MSVLTDATRLAEQLMADPVLRDYARRSMGASYQPLKNPEDVIGEQSAVAFSMVKDVLEARPNSGLHWYAVRAKVDGMRAAAAMLAVAKSLVGAEPYLWLSDVRKTAAVQNVPRHTFDVSSVQVPMWWTWDVDLDMPGGLTAVGALWIPQPNGVQIVLVGRVSGMAVIYGVLDLPRGFTFPDDVPNHADAREHYESMLAMLSFLRSPYIPKVSRRMSPKLERAFRREGLDAGRAQTTVHFIDLRSPEGDATDGSSSGHEYRHRWIVRGHHRAQWYPSQEAHRLIWVAPYIKGPEGAPMLLPAYRVAR